MYVDAVLLDIGVIAKCERSAAIGQIVRREPWIAGDQARVGNAEEKILIQERVLNRESGLEIIVMVGIRIVGLNACIHQLPVLADGGREIRERVRARIVGHLVTPDVRIHRDRGVRVQNVDPSGRDVVTDDQLALILTRELLIVCVGRLEPARAQRRD